MTTDNTHGHSYGDDILSKVGACLASTCRSSELVARFGGEEFIFALTGTDAEAVHAFSERIHNSIKDAMSQTHPITVSIGAASRFGRYGPSYPELLSQADKALYNAKETGKNKTVIGGNVQLLPHTKAS